MLCCSNWSSDGLCARCSCAAPAAPSAGIHIHPYWLLLHAAGSPLTVKEQCLAGAVAGVPVSLLATPTELLKCRLQAQAGRQPPPGKVYTLQEIQVGVGVQGVREEANTPPFQLVCYIGGTGHRGKLSPNALPAWHRRWQLQWTENLQQLCWASECTAAFTSESWSLWLRCRRGRRCFVGLWMCCGMWCGTRAA